MSTPTKKTKAEVGILVVDDSPNDAELISMDLQRAGYRDITHYKESRDALAFLEKGGNANVLVWDTQAPSRPNSYNICGELRNQPYGKSIVVIGASSHQEFKQNWHENGADGFVDKNKVNYRELDATIQAALKTRQGLEIIANAS